MLWFKGWLEMRWRFLFGLGLPAFILISAYQRGTPSALQIANLLGAFSLLWVISAAMLAGTGIKTQSGSLGNMMKGLHGSTAFTLSLPVSRFRLVAVRTMVGLLGLTSITMIVSVTAFVFLPGLHATLLDAVEQGVAGLTCTLVFYFLSALLATVLDAQWQLYGTMIAALLLRWLFGVVSMPRSLDFFRATGDMSPLVTHTLPWEAMSVSIVLSAVLLVAMLKIVQSSEY